MRRLLTVAVMTAALAGCGPGGQTAGADGGTDRPGDFDGAGDPDAPAAFDAVIDAGADTAAGGTAAAACREAIATQCRRQSVCRGIDPATCVAAISPFADRCPEYYFNPRSLRTVADIEACLTALGQAPCTDIAMLLTPPCLKNGTGAAGTACLYNTECEFGCPDGLGNCATCRAAAWAATGAPCDSTHFCATTDYCHIATRTCTPKASIVHAAEGQPCDFYAQPPIGCLGDLVCARPSSGGTAGICRPIPKVGEPCAMTGDVVGAQPLCGPGLACDAQMRCQPAPPPSNGCGDGGACDAASFCRGAFGPQAACAPRAAEGQPCRLTDTTEGLELACPIGIRCVLTPDAGFNGTCTRLGSIGDTCDTARPCNDALCSVAGRCTPYAVAACQP
jgi:hypothetical protein